MKVLIDMNLSPEWVPVLADQGIKAAHWSTMGDPRADDTEILAWAKKNDYVVFTNDLDFGRILALTYANGPSVLQIRGKNLLPEAAAAAVLAALAQCAGELQAGALITIDESSLRARILPICE